MKRYIILLTAILTVVGTGCGTTKFAVKRMAPARYDISGIKRIGVLNFGTGYEKFAGGAAVLTTAIEDKLVKSGFFDVAPRINEYQGAPFQATPAVFPDILAKVGREAGVDLLVFGVVEKYDSRTVRDQIKKEKDIPTGQYRTENYVENGVTKTRQVEIVRKEIYYVPTAKRQAAIDLYGYALNTDTEKFAGKDEYSDGITKKAEGDSDIRSLPSEESMLARLTDRISDMFVANLTPHEVTEYIRLISGKCCKDGMKMAKAGDWAGATDSFDAAVLADPNDHVARYNLGIAYEYQRELEKARECYREAMGLSNKPLYNEAWVRVHYIIQQNQTLKEQLKGR